MQSSVILHQPKRAKALFLYPNFKEGGDNLNNKKFWQFNNEGNDLGELMPYGDIASSTWWGDEITRKISKQIWIVWVIFKP